MNPDNAYNTVPPEYVGLLCLRPAKSGGHSRVVSFHSAHNELLTRHPNVLPRLYRPFLFDRQKEFHPGEEPTLPAPVFEMNGELRSRFSAHQIRGGYAMTGQPVDEEGTAALSAMLDVLDDDRLSADFDLEAGQIQIVDNRALGHSRTAFEDHRNRAAARTWCGCGCATTAAAPIPDKQHSREAKMDDRAHAAERDQIV